MQTQFPKPATQEMPRVGLPSDQWPFSCFEDAMASKLLNAGAEVYRFGDKLVLPNNEKRHFDVLDADQFPRWSQKFVLTCAGSVLKEMPRSLVTRLLASQEFLSAFPQIEKLQPFPGPATAAGGIQICSGYQKETRTFFFPMVEGYEQYDESMTLQEASDFLRWIYREFPIIGWKKESANADEGTQQSRSLAVQVAAMLAQFADACVPIEANRMGFAYLGTCPSILKTRMAYIVKMLSPRKCSSTEEETFLICGNERPFTPAISERCLQISLGNPQSETQGYETGDSVDEVWFSAPANRHKILSALWVIVRYWYAGDERSGPMPGASKWGYRPQNGFERWGEIIGGMVAFAGFGNCLETVEHAGSLEDHNVRQLLRILADDVAGSGQKAKEYEFQRIVNECHKHRIFDYKLDGAVGESGDFKLTSKANSSFGILLCKIGPSKKASSYDYAQGEVIYFSNNGKKGRHKRYSIEVRRA